MFIGISPSYARISLNGGERVAIPTKTGYFSFPNMLAGMHTMEVHLTGYVWHTFSVDMSEDGKPKVYKLGTKERLPPKLIVRPLSKAKYKPDPVPYDPLKIIKSPMGIMMTIMLVSTIVMPKLMESVKEQQREMAQQQAAEAARAQGGGQGAPPAASGDGGNTGGGGSGGSHSQSGGGGGGNRRKRKNRG